MTYPRPQEYSEAMQLPKLSILDPALAMGTVQTDPMGLPFGRTGQFALTFKVTSSGRAYAFRCFLQERATIHQRYTAISQFLEGKGSPYFVEFAYQESGIRIGGSTYPVVRMSWAEGVPLGLYIQDHHRDPSVMRQLRTHLRDLARYLAAEGIAHGDIQSGNILVSPTGGLTLVDYDGMFIPSLTALGAIETGHPNFQHPGRISAKPFDANVDAFSFALLDTALRALIEDPTLWTRLKADPDRILLGARDLAAPETSAAFGILTALTDSGPAARNLRAIARAPYAAVPAYADFVQGHSIPEAPIEVSPSAAGGSTPWYHEPVEVNAPQVTSAHPTAITPAAAPSGLPIVSAGNAQTWPTRGEMVELIGIVDSVTGGSNGNLPYQRITLKNTENPVTIDIWAEGLANFTRAGVTIGKKWQGKWISVQGQWRDIKATDGLRYGITVTAPSQVQRLTEHEARARLNASRPPALSSSGTNDGKIAALSTTSADSKSRATKPLSVTTPSSGGRSWSSPSETMHYTLPIILGLLVAAILVALIVGVAMSQGSNQSLGDLDYTNATELAPDSGNSSATEVLEPVQEPICFDRNFESTACGPQVAFESTAGVIAEWECANSQVALPVDSLDGANYLCLNEVNPTSYRTCVKGDPRYRADGSSYPNTCFTRDAGLFWRYDMCWTVGNAELQQRDPESGAWRTVKKGIGEKNGCADEYPEFPWWIQFERNVSGEGTRQYRLYFPPQNGYDATYSYLVATTTAVDG